MIDDPQTVLFGSAVVIAGLLFGKFGVHMPNSIPSTEDEREEAAFFERQARRRYGVAFLFVLCGLLLLTSGLVDARVRPTLSLTLALLSVPLMLWSTALAIADAFLSRARHRRELRTVESERKKMEREIAELQDRDGTR